MGRDDDGFHSGTDGELVFEHFRRVVDRSGILHLDVALNDKGGLLADELRIGNLQFRAQAGMTSLSIIGVGDVDFLCHNC